MQYLPMLLCIGPIFLHGDLVRFKTSPEMCAEQRWQCARDAAAFLLAGSVHRPAQARAPLRADQLQQLAHHTEALERGRDARILR